jgi:hypothetical protein
LSPGIVLLLRVQKEPCPRRGKSGTNPTNPEEFGRICEADLTKVCSDSWLVNLSSLPQLSNYKSKDFRNKVMKFPHRILRLYIR